MHDNVLVLNDKVLILYDDMVRYWYCANIPPRSLEDKTKRMEFGVKKPRGRRFDQSERGKRQKKIVWKQNVFLQDVGGGRLWKVGGWEVGGWAVRIEKSVRTVGRLGR